MARDPYRWVVLAIGVWAQAGLSIYIQGLASIGPLLQRHFRVTLVETGFLISAASIGVAVTLIAWGIAADRFGERVVLAAGLAGAGAGLTVAALEPNFALASAALIAAGMAGACVNNASGKAVMVWFDSGERGLALGIRQTGTPLGGALGALVLPPVASRFGVPAAIGFLALNAFAAAAACWAGIHRPEGAVPPGRRRPDASASPLRDPRIWQLSFGGSLVVAGQISVIAYFVFFLSVHRGMPLQTAATLLMLCQLGGATMRIVAGRWSDQAGSRLRPMLLLVTAGAGLYLLLATLTQAPLQVTIPVLLALTVIAMSTNGLGFTAAGEIAGAERAATAMGLQNTLLYVTGAIGPVVTGLVITTAGYPAAFALLAALSLIGGAVIFPLARRELRGWRPRTVELN